MNPDGGYLGVLDPHPRHAGATAGGQIVKVSPWGRRRLAYPIAKHHRGIYVYVKYLGKGATVAEIERLPGRHLFFLDDNIFGDPHFAATLFDGMRGLDQLIWALAFVRAVGLGPLAGVMAIAAAEIISHFGARPEADLRALARAAGLG